MMDKHEYLKANKWVEYPNAAGEMGWNPSWWSDVAHPLYAKDEAFTIQGAIDEARSDERRLMRKAIPSEEIDKDHQGRSIEFYVGFNRCRALWLAETRRMTP